jgi:hypothetical protein
MTRKSKESSTQEITRWEGFESLYVLYLNLEIDIWDEKKTKSGECTCNSML